MDYSDYMTKYKKTTFYDQIEGNKWKSWLLLIVIVGIIILLAYLIGSIYNPESIFVFLIFGIIISLIYVWIGYYYSDKIALASVHAYPAEGPDYNQLNNLIEGLAIASGLPKPKVYIMPSPEINAFATGRDPEHAVICVSVGCVKNLSKKELEGVIAHEMTHIANFDIKFVTLVVVLVGLIAIISELFLRTLWFSNGDRDNKNTLILIIGIVFAILAPIVANLVQLAISRKREYMADAGAVQLCRDNSGLISALKKIDLFYKAKNVKPIASKTVATMMIANPFSGRSISNLFSTHPPIEDRIKVLEQM